MPLQRNQERLLPPGPVPRSPTRVKGTNGLPTTAKTTQNLVAEPGGASPPPTWATGLPGSVCRPPARRRTAHARPPGRAHSASSRAGRAAAFSVLVPRRASPTGDFILRPSRSQDTPGGWTSHPGTSKGHFKGMCSTRSVVVTPSPHPGHHPALVIFRRNFCIQPLLCTSTALSNPQHQSAGPQQ